MDVISIIFLMCHSVGLGITLTIFGGGIYTAMIFRLMANTSASSGPLTV